MPCAEALITRPAEGVEGHLAFGDPSVATASGIEKFERDVTAEEWQSKRQSPDGIFAFLASSSSEEGKSLQIRNSQQSLSAEPEEEVAISRYEKQTLRHFSPTRPAQASFPAGFRAWSVQTAEKSPFVDFDPSAALEVLERLAPFPPNGAFRARAQRSYLRSKLETDSSFSSVSVNAPCFASAPERFETLPLEGLSTEREAPVVGYVRTAQGFLLPESVASFVSSNEEAPEDFQTLWSLEDFKEDALQSFLAEDFARGASEERSSVGVCQCSALRKKHKSHAVLDSWENLSGALASLSLDTASNKTTHLSKMPNSDCAAQLTLRLQRLVVLEHEKCQLKSSFSSSEKEQVFCTECQSLSVKTPAGFCAFAGRLAVASEKQPRLRLLSLSLMERVLLSLLHCAVCRKSCKTDAALAALDDSLEKLLGHIRVFPSQELVRHLRENAQQRLLERILKLGILFLAEKARRGDLLGGFGKEESRSQAAALRTAIAVLFCKESSFHLREVASDLVAFTAAAIGEASLFRTQPTRRGQAPHPNEHSAISALLNICGEGRRDDHSPETDVALVELLSSFACLMFLEEPSGGDVFRTFLRNGKLLGIQKTDETCSLACVSHAASGIVLRLLRGAERILWRGHVDACSPLPLSVHLGEALHAVVLRICEAESRGVRGGRVFLIEQKLRGLLCRCLLGVDFRLSRCLSSLWDFSFVFPSKVEEAELRDAESMLDGAIVLLPLAFLSKNDEENASLSQSELSRSACRALCGMATSLLRIPPKFLSPFEGLLSKLLLASARGISLWRQKANSVASAEADVGKSVVLASTALLQNAFSTCPPASIWMNAQFADEFLKAAGAWASWGGLDFEGPAEGRAESLSDALLLSCLRTEDTFLGETEFQKINAGDSYVALEFSTRSEFIKTAILRLRFASAVLKGVTETLECDSRARPISLEALAKSFTSFVDPFLTFLIHEAKGSVRSKHEDSSASTLPTPEAADAERQLVRSQVLFDVASEACLSFSYALRVALRREELSKATLGEPKQQLLSRFSKRLIEAFAAVAHWALDSPASELSRKKSLLQSKERNEDVPLLSAEGPRVLNFLVILLTDTHALKGGETLGAESSKDKAERLAVSSLLAPLLLAFPLLRVNLLQLWKRSLEIDAQSDGEDGRVLPFETEEDVLQTLMNFLDSDEAGEESASLKDLLNRDDWADSADALLDVITEAAKTASFVGDDLSLRRKRLFCLLKSKELVLARLEAERRELAPPSKQ